MELEILLPLYNPLLSVLPILFFRMIMKMQMMTISLTSCFISLLVCSLFTVWYIVLVSSYIKANFGYILYGIVYKGCFWILLLHYVIIYDIRNEWNDMAMGSWAKCDVSYYMYDLNFKLLFVSFITLYCVSPFPKFWGSHSQHFLVSPFCAT